NVRLWAAPPADRWQLAPKPPLSGGSAGTADEIMSEEPTAVRIARLMASAPEAVFEEWKADHRDWYRADTEELEAALTHRSHPLIDLALARYGRSQAVVAGLLEAGLEKPTDERDAMQLRGLRMSCFANERFDFGSQGLMQRVVSPEQAASIIATSDFSELVVLLRNPNVGDDTLAELFLGTGPFEGLEEERWLTMVQIAADNPRLMAPNDETHGPDFGYWNIHKALFQLVKKAPVTERWCFALLAALVRAHPPSVVIDEPIAGPLERWSGFEARDRKGEIDEGLYTDLTRGEEFRCLIASLYGTRWIDGKKVHAGSPLSPTLAERCAYYAGATLSKKDVETFAKKDGSGF